MMNLSDVQCLKLMVKTMVSKSDQRLYGEIDCIPILIGVFLCFFVSSCAQL